MARSLIWLFDNVAVTASVPRTMRGT
jgi:hypothetical protein